MIGSTVSCNSSQPSLSFQGSRIRKRTLDNYPMQHSRSDLRQMVAWQRLVKQERVHTASRTKTASGNLVQYSKSLFEDAVSKAKGEEESDSTSSLPRLRGCEHHQHRNIPSYAQRMATSGPTQHGSPLYDKKAKMMNTIRIRSSTVRDKEELNTRVRHLNPEIRALLQQSNMTYKVISPSSTPTSLSQSLISCSTQATLGDFIFVPMDMESTFEDSATSMTQPVRAGDTGYCNGSPHQDCRLQSISSHGGSPPKGNASAACSSHASSDEEDEAQVDDSKDLRNNLATNNQKTKLKTDQQQSRKHSQASSNGSDRSCQSQEKGHHWCWVDDATVTSIHSHHSVSPDAGVTAAGTTLTPTPVGTGVKPGEKTVTFDDKAKQKDQTEKLAQDVKELQLESAQQNGITEPLEGGEDAALVLSLQELQGKEWSLPNFICPSSENKSRQARIKDWLETSSFTWASRSVPLM